MLFPKLTRFCLILLFLLCEQINTGWMSRLSRYQSVSQFSQGSNATLLVKGDTVSGCKLVLLDRVRNKTCCFSAPERKESMCEPSIQSGGCRSLESVKVEEHPGYCKIVFFRIKKEDAGPYLVIFPGKVNDNEQFDIKVSDDSEERILPGLPPVSDISRFEEVEDFFPGSTATVSVLGNTESGCKFLLLAGNLTCCFSATSRKDTLCHPGTQSGGCRAKERFRVDELPDSCLLTMPDIDENDVGSYKGIFPGRLLDNLKINVTLKIMASEKSDFVWVFGGLGLAAFVTVVVCFAIGFLCYSKQICHQTWNKLEHQYKDAFYFK